MDTDLTKMDTGLIKMDIELWIKWWDRILVDYQEIISKKGKHIGTLPEYYNKIPNVSPIIKRM